MPDPVRDLSTWDGWRENPHMPHVGRVHLVRYEHTAPDGTAVVCLSQRITLPGTADHRTLDRWEVDGQPAGTTARPGLPNTPPDFAAFLAEVPAPRLPDPVTPTRRKAPTP
ncbi:MAG: hypothetical protein ACRDRO_04030 [Pseudonocardiaceae bacterium]